MEEHSGRVCGAIDRSCIGDDLGFTFKDRRDVEDVLPVTRCADLPCPENQFVALAHSLAARGVIDEGELRARLTSIRNRLESLSGIHRGLRRGLGQEIDDVLQRYGRLWCCDVAVAAFGQAATIQCDHEIQKPRHQRANYAHHAVVQH